MQKQQIDISFVVLCALWLVAVAAYLIAAATKSLEPTDLAFFKDTAIAFTGALLALFRSNPAQIHYVSGPALAMPPTQPTNTPTT